MGNGLGFCQAPQVDLKELVTKSPEAAAVHTKLVDIIHERPYIDRKVHPLHRWVGLCRQCLEKNEVADAQDHVGRIEAALKVDQKRLRATFHKFDLDNSGHLEAEEFRHFATYVGFGPQVVDQALQESDNDRDNKLSIEEFDAFVGRAGGIHSLLEARRNAVSNNGDEHVEILVGSRVRAHYQEPSDGKNKRGSAQGAGKARRSEGVWDARVLEIDPNRASAKLEFGTGKSKRVETVPMDWIEEDIDLIDALSGIGIFDDAQHYWTILLPNSEQTVVKTLTQSQMAALDGVRQQAEHNHNSAILKLMERCSSIGINSGELWSVLTWIRDNAPVIVHLDLDLVCKFFEQDTHYRNQFETKTSQGLLCAEIREKWESTLFGAAYDSALPFERPKYGVLDVMNDHRGVLCARQYGDSYVTLKNVRLRCTFAPEDSGGIAGERLAVLDQYAHVLLEYSDEELSEVSRVANAKLGSDQRIGKSENLNGFHYKEAQIHGEVCFAKHVQRLVVHPRHRVDGISEQQLRTLCSQHGWEFVWMDDERKRRIYEERRQADTQVLEMSWANEAMSGQVTSGKSSPLLMEAASNRNEQ